MVLLAEPVTSSQLASELYSSPPRMVTLWGNPVCSEGNSLETHVKEGLTLFCLVVKDNFEEGTLNAQTIVVVNETQVSELVHERTNPRAARADHLRQSILADLGNYMQRFGIFTEIGKH